jgi:hypothetical protein
MKLCLLREGSEKNPSVEKAGVATSAVVDWGGGAQLLILVPSWQVDTFAT